MDRRLQIWQLNYRSLREILGGGVQVINSNLPEGAEIVQVRHDETALCFNLFVRHESFPEVPEFEMIPFGDPVAYMLIDSQSQELPS